ncbi:MAG: LPXTG cell wall anchor domain-containing protein [Fimbriiglobus sp.]
MEMFSSWPVMIGMAVLLLALVGVMIFLRSKKDDE